MARPTLPDGRAALRDVLKRAGYPSMLHALAEHTVFLHPITVGQTNGRPLFRVIRGPGAAVRGTIVDADDGGTAMLDDNTAPTHAFLWSADREKGRDLQFNHIWALSKDVRYYTALWNLCATPAFLAKLTDGDQDARDLLAYRSWELYGFVPEGKVAPERPVYYEDLAWPVSPPPVDDLESVLRERLRASPKSRTAVSVRECGWLYGSSGE